MTGKGMSVAVARVLERAEAIANHVGAEYEEDRGLDYLILQLREAINAVQS